jgi:hypothetical protein
MKFSFSTLLFAGALSAASVAHAQEAAGRVMVAVGDVSVVRGDQKIPVKSGSEIRAGDTVQLGSQSNAQILFSDQSIVALRADTLFRVSEYSYSARESETGRAFFDLLKGGLRTVTGLIGKRNHQNYNVGTPVSTIGIRGTHYTLVHCDNSCRNPNGSLAPNGTYGGVTDGRISVTNQSGEQVFGVDQSFHVASLTSAPQQLIAPPGFLRDTLEGRSRSSKNQDAATAGVQQGQQSGQQQSTVAPTGQNGGTGDSRVSSFTTTVSAPSAVTTNAFQQNNSATASVQGLTDTIQQTFSGTVFYRVSGSLNIPVTGCGSPPCSTITFGEITLGVNLSAGRATVGVNILGSGSAGIRNYSTPATLGGFPITISGNQIVFNATLNLADFPLSQGAFRCSDCGPNGTVGFADQITISGTISGGQAAVTLSAVEPNGTGSFTVALPQVALPNNSSAALAVRNFAGGNDARSASYWNVALDASGRLLGFGPITNGAVSASVGGAANTIVGTASSYGNLVWGQWGAGSNLADFNYVSGTNSQVVPWITGDAVNNIPPSLGTQTYTMIPGATVFRGAGIMNSATLVADFVNRTINVSLNATSGANTFQMNGSGGFAPTNGRFSQAFNSVTCSGPCGAPPYNGNYGGFFAGPQAQGAGIAFTGGNGTIGVTGVVGLRR